MTTASALASAGPRAALAAPDFRRYQVARFLLVLGVQMQSVAVGWHVYSITQSPLHLGYVGLAQFLPALLLSLVTGDTADRFDRRRILLVCYSALALCALLLFALAQGGVSSVGPLYAVLVLLGVARAFTGPAAHALVTHLVPPSTSPAPWPSTPPSSRPPPLSGPPWEACCTAPCRPRASTPPARC